MRSWMILLVEMTNLQVGTDRVEEPAVRIDLLLVLGLENEDDLNWYEIVRIIALGKNQLRRSIHRQLSGILWAFE
jgi:hypothetical protein